MAFPVIAPGWAGRLTGVTANVCAVDVPQELVAVTVMFPLVALAVAVMEVVVEVPVHPPGKTQV